MSFFGPIAERSKAKPNQTNDIPENLPRSKCSKYRALVNGTCQGILFEVEALRSNLSRYSCQVIFTGSSIRPREFLGTGD